LIQNPAEIPEPSSAPAGDDFYFERLELHPIKLSLSFMRTERVNSDEKYVEALSFRQASV
jgi:vacuolar protein sorting-associated protein 13A/C